MKPSQKGNYPLRGKEPFPGNWKAISGRRLKWGKRLLVNLRNPGTENSQRDPK